MVRVSRLSTWLVLILFVLAGCGDSGRGSSTSLGSSGASQSGSDAPSVYMREVQRGEVVPAKGPHRHVSSTTRPRKVLLQRTERGLELPIAFNISRTLRFLIRFADEGKADITCPQDSVDPEDTTADGKWLNQVVRDYGTVALPAGTWQTILRLGQPGGPSGTDWQVWWGSVPPDAGQ